METQIWGNYGRKYLVVFKRFPMTRLKVKTNDVGRRQENVMELKLRLKLAAKETVRNILSN